MDPPEYPYPPSYLPIAAYVAPWENQAAFFPQVPHWISGPQQPSWSPADASFHPGWVSPHHYPTYGLKTMSADHHDAVGYHSVTFQDHLEYHAPLSSISPAVSGHTARQQRGIATSPTLPQMIKASIPRTQDSNMGHKIVGSPLSPNDGLTASRAILVSSQNSEAEGYISELPATVAESQNDITGSTLNTIRKEPVNSQSGHLLIGYVAVSLSAKSDSEQAGSDRAQPDVRGTRDSSGSSARNSLNPPSMVSTGGSTYEVLPPAVPNDLATGNASRKRRYAETRDNSEEASHTSKALPSPRKRPKMEPVEIGRSSAQQEHAQMKLLQSQVPGSGPQRPARVLRSVKASSSTKPSKTLGHNPMLDRPRFISPASTEQLSETNDTKRGYVETSSDYHQQTKSTDPFRSGQNPASPLPIQQKGQRRCNKRACKSPVAASSASTPPAARTDHTAQRTRINEWMDRNTESDRDKQHEQRKKMLEVMSKSKSPVIKEAALRNKEDYCTAESHPACCHIKLTHAEAEEMKEDLGWLPVNITYITEEDIHFYDGWW